MYDDVADDVKEICLIVDVLYVDWIMRWIGRMSIELYLSTYSGPSLYS
jgi:hypothetical protein